MESPVQAPAPDLPGAFLTTPIAHRGLYDIAAGIPENSRAAFQAAIAAGYGIELDIQPNRDNEAMVFHDYDMNRLTGKSGAIQQRSTGETQAQTLLGTAETIPTLREVLDLIAGQVPVLVEIKDQDGAMGPATGALEKSVAAALEGYDGPIALMSFNPHSVAALAKHAPDIPRGLITKAWTDAGSRLVPEERKARLREIPDYNRVGACFISHQATDLDRPRVRALKKAQFTKRMHGL